MVLKNWLKPRPALVMVMLFVAPAAALTHLVLNWVPETLAVMGLTDSVHRDRQEVARCCDELECALQDSVRLRALAQQPGAARRAPWLPRREQPFVSNTLAETLQGDDVTVEGLSFEEVALYAAAPETGILACEQVAVTCRGPYAGLTERLDCLIGLDLPLRLTRLSWRRGEGHIDVDLHVQVPFMPDGALEAALRAEAGLEEDDEF